MKKTIFLLLLACCAATTVAEAGQFRIAPPRDMRKRQPPPNYRESRLQIINDDDRGYAIDVDYRRNRLELVHRSQGDIYVPGNSSIVLTFDDDDDWRILGDNESLNIQIRSGRTTTLRLETRANRHQIGLFGTVEDGPRRSTAQLFRYSDRPGRPGPGSGPGHGPGPAVNRPNHARPPAPAPAPRPPTVRPPQQPHKPSPSPAPRPQPQPQKPAPRPQPHPDRGGPSKGSPTLGKAVGGIIDHLVDKR